MTTKAIVDNVNLQVVLWAFFGAIYQPLKRGWDAGVALWTWMLWAWDWVAPHVRTGAGFVRKWAPRIAVGLAAWGLLVSAFWLTVVYWPVTLCVAGIVVFAWVTYPR